MTPPHLPRKPRRGETLDVTPTTISRRGHGLAFYDVLIGPQAAPRTFRVEVRSALPGEHVRMRIERLRKNDIQGGVVEYLQPRSDRTEPRCSHFGRREEPNKGCGGCVFQSLPYPRQLELKRDHIARCLNDTGIDTSLLGEPIGQDPPWYYRNKMEFSFGPTSEDLLGCGLHPSGYHREVIALEHCYLLSPEGSAIAVAAQEHARAQGLETYHHKRNTGWLRTLMIREGKRTGERMIEVTTSEHDPVVTGEGEQAAEDVARALIEVLLDVEGAPVTSAWWTQMKVKKGERTTLTEHLIHGGAALHEELELPGGHRLRFAIHPRAFFQPNTLQAERLYAEALRATGLLDAAGGTVFDLYCGTGTIALCMAPYTERVIGVELVEDAVLNARANATHNALNNVEFHAGDVGEVLAGALKDVRPELVVVDPPRSGLMPAARAHLIALAPARLVYVSCNPEALARDLAELHAAGFVTRSITPVDMFPHTAHVENVAVIDGP